MMVDLREFIDPDDIVLIGVSGGADSLCLLDLADELRKKMRFKLVALHVNHGIRGEEALRDQKAVELFCARRGIDLEVSHVDAPKLAARGLSLEQAARELRYQEFERVQKKVGANKVLVAHNLNDQAETVLMHIARGSSISGASAMSERGDKVIRPLLNTSRAEIEDYCRARGIEYVIDSSNLCTDYSRNFIRHEVLPLLKKVYPSVEGALCSFAKMCRADDEFIARHVDETLISEVKGGVLIKAQAAGLEDVLLSRLIMRALKSIGVVCDIGRAHLAALKDLFSSQSGRRIALPHGIVARREQDGLFITREGHEKCSDEAAFKCGRLRLGERVIVVEKCKVPSGFEKGIQIIDMNKVPPDATFRTRRDGDYFTKLGSCGKKKLSDYLTDKKVPMRHRDEVVVLASGSEVLAALGLDIGERVKVDPSTTRAAKISLDKDD